MNILAYPTILCFEYQHIPGSDVPESLRITIATVVVEQPEKRVVQVKSDHLPIELK